VSIVGALIILMATMGFAVLVCWYTRRQHLRWPLVRNPEHASERPNDLSFGYSIIIGFVLVAALGTYQDAKLAATSEAQAITSLSRTALQIPAVLRDDLDHQLVCYGRDVIKYDWTAATDGTGGGTLGGSPFVDASANRIPQTIQRVAAPGVQVRDATLGALIQQSEQLSQARADRLDQAQRLPLLFWVMLVIGGAVFISLSAILLADDHAYLQLMIAGGTALLIAFTLILIGSLDRPFSSQPPLPVIHPVAMQRALDGVIVDAPDPAVDRPCP
jgi:hypothetical protein